MLGSFRYCVNEFAKDEAGKAMFPGLVRLMWTGARDGKRYVRERDLTLRPEVAQSRRYQGEYEELLKRLQGYLATRSKAAWLGPTAFSHMRAWSRCFRGRARSSY